MKKLQFILSFLLLSFLAHGQDDLLDDLEQEADTKPQQTSAVFKGIKIVNFESTKLVGKNQLYFTIYHRFGSLQNGLDNFFGLDDASARIQFLYGINDWLQIGASRSGFNKTYDATVKYRLFTQKENGFPFSIVGFNAVNVNTNLSRNFFPNITFSDRLGFTNQLIISKKLNKSLSLAFIPTHFHDNTVVEDGQENSQFALGFGGRVKLTKRFALIADYGLHLNRVENSVFKNPLAVGIEIETGGHVFQLHFSNARAIYENGFLGQARGDFGDGNIFFGFNLSRAFSL